MTIEEAFAYFKQIESDISAAPSDATFTLTKEQLSAVIWMSEQRGIQREQEAATKDAERKAEEGW